MAWLKYTLVSVLLLSTMQSNAESEYDYIFNCHWHNKNHENLYISIADSLIKRQIDDQIFDYQIKKVTDSLIHAIGEENEFDEWAIHKVNPGDAPVTVALTVLLDRSRVLYTLQEKAGEPENNDTDADADVELYPKT